jgi:hypothetical protein
VCPVTISLAMKSVKPCSADRRFCGPRLFSTSALNQRGGADGELWQHGFFDRALRSPENHPNHVIPAKAGIHFVRNVDPRLRGGDEKGFHFLGWAKGPCKLGQGIPRKGGPAQTLFFNVFDLPKASFAEGCEKMPRPPPWSLREIADSKLRSLRQPPVAAGPPAGLRPRRSFMHAPLTRELHPQNIVSQQWIGCREQARRASLAGGEVALLTEAHT